MKKLAIILVLSLLLSTLSGCGIIIERLNAVISSHRNAVEMRQNEDDPQDIVVEVVEAGLVYMDPNTDVFLYIMQSGWYYYKDQTTGITYFMNKGLDEPSSIALSSQPLWVSTDPIRDIWERVRKAQPADTIILGEKEVKIGEAEYTGRYYDYTVTVLDIPANMRYYIWITEDRIYLCSQLFVEKDRAAVLAAGEDIIRSFRTYKELSK